MSGTIITTTSARRGAPRGGGGGPERPGGGGAERDGLAGEGRRVAVEVGRGQVARAACEGQRLREVIHLEHALLAEDDDAPLLLRCQPVHVELADGSPAPAAKGSPSRSMPSPSVGSAGALGADGLLP